MPIRSASDTKFLFYPVFNRVIQHSADGGKSLLTRIVSATAGPFDFSAAVSAAAVTIFFKVDNGAALSETLDLSAVGNIASVTVAELVSAFTAASVTGYTASAESGTGYFKIVKTTPGSAKYLQVYGEVADATGIKSLIFKGDSQKSIAVTPTMVEAERLEAVDSLGKKASVVVGSYRTGAAIVLTDTAMSKELRAAIEGGTLTTGAYTSKQYNAPGPDTVHPIVSVEAFFAMFAKNDNQATAPVGYLWLKYDSAVGSCGALAGDRNAQDWTYSFDAVPYRDPVAGTTAATDEVSQELTVAEFAALDVFNV